MSDPIVFPSARFFTLKAIVLGESGGEYTSVIARCTSPVAITPAAFSV